MSTLGPNRGCYNSEAEMSQMSKPNTGRNRNRIRKQKATYICTPSCSRSRSVHCTSCSRSRSVHCTSCSRSRSAHCTSKSNAPVRLKVLSQAGKSRIQKSLAGMLLAFLSFDITIDVDNGKKVYVTSGLASAFLEHAPYKCLRLQRPQYEQQTSRSQADIKSRSNGFSQHRSSYTTENGARVLEQLTHRRTDLGRIPHTLHEQ